MTSNSECNAIIKLLSMIQNDKTMHDILQKMWRNLKKMSNKTTPEVNILKRQEYTEVC